MFFIIFATYINWSCHFIVMKKMIWLFALVAVPHLYAEVPSLQQALDSLDHIILVRDEFAQVKEAEIDALQRDLVEETNLERRFEILGKLVDANKSYNLSAQMAWVRQRLAVSVEAKNDEWRLHATLDMIECLYLVGMYKEAGDLLREVRRNDLPGYLRPYYYHLNRTYYGLLADYSSEEDYAEHYFEVVDNYRDSIMMVNDELSFTYIVVKADKYIYHRFYVEALNLLKAYCEQNNVQERDMAIVYYSMAEIYAKTEQWTLAKTYYALSAQCDLKSAVREYAALRKLAELLFRDGDVERAHNYIKCSTEDAFLGNARVRTIELLPLYSIIENAYQHQLSKQRETSVRFTYSVSVLLLILLVTFVFVIYQNRKLSAIRKKLKLANEDLKYANATLAESNHIKEEYISRYMDQCSLYIGKMDDYRRSLNRLAAQGREQELLKNIKSSDFINRELKTFYSNFDESFLRLYPDFVEKFNDLLLPDSHIYPKGELLTPELRIYALVRLGITDSAKIAQFLRYSVTTIYNYRTKMRNAAACPRDEFDRRVMEI